MKQNLTKVEEETNLIELIVENYKTYNSDPTIITSIGKEEIDKLRTISDILEQPVSNLMSNKGSVQDTISNNLLGIKTEADKINPQNFNLSPGFIGRLIEKVTGSTALNKYASKFSSVKETIESISTSLTEGIVLLRSDNFNFNKDKDRFREAADSLDLKISYLIRLNEELDMRILNEKDLENVKFLSENVSFDLKSHIIDLQTIQSAAQQGLIALNILISNNKELIKGVERTKNVAIPVLSIGFTIATGLANQKKVLDTVKVVNQQTSELMLKNAEMLKTQGIEIQKQASSAVLNLEDMQKAINMLINTVEEVEDFRVESLGGMQETITELGLLSNKIDKKLIKN